MVYSWKICGLHNILWKLNLTLKGHDETENSKNPETFCSLINLVSKLDRVLKQHIEKTENEVFLSLSKTIQSELLDPAIWSNMKCLHSINNKILKSNYISIEALCLPWRKFLISLWQINDSFLYSNYLSVAVLLEPLLYF